MEIVKNTYTNQKPIPLNIEKGSNMYVIKRDGREEKLQFDKITARIEKLCDGLDTTFVNAIGITMKVVNGIHSGITTKKIDDLAAETCAYMSTSHNDYSKLAGRICASNLQKEISDDYLTMVTKMREYVHPKTGEFSPIVSSEFFEVVKKHEYIISKALKDNQFRDFEYDYFAFKTLERAYLLKMNGKICETPQMLLMRVSIGINGDDIDSIIEMYNTMSAKDFTMATPTLFNSGTTRPQMSSCFLLDIKGDSIEGIFDTVSDCAKISKSSGGIGLNIHKIRATGSYIKGSGGRSDGLVNMLRCFNNVARYVNQGGRRNGSFAMYLEPWHADIEAYIDLKKNHGNDMERARDLFYAIWTPDLFMKRVESDGNWSLLCPNECPGLDDVYGEEFDKLYTSYENIPLKVRKTIKARDLWNKIIDSQVETGVPYILSKDSCNIKSNQKNLGTIKSSNLCTEIVQYTSKDEIAVCNLASVSLASMVKDPYSDNAIFDFDKLQKITRIVTFGLNKVIDKNWYPVPEAEISNKKHRPIGIGVQGLADTFIMMNMPFDSPEARELNRNIFETMYYSAVNASVDLAAKDGSYSSYKGSPMSEGKFQFDLWNVDPGNKRHDWNALREKMLNTGLRNSLLLSPMPTASSASILGNNESFEPFTSNLYTRRVLSGEFCMVNKHLIRELTNRGIWTDDTKEHLMKTRGSVQNLMCLPPDRRSIYKTSWEISQKVIIDQAADRGPFICQSQSMNLNMQSPSRAKISSMLFYSWKKGLKTLIYYLRTKPKTEGIQMAIGGLVANKKPEEVVEEQDCLTCSA